MRKSSLIKSVLLTGIVLITMSQTLTAQRGVGQIIPDLTEEQETKIKEMKTIHMKDMLKLKSELKEKNARLKSLQTADDVDMDKIYKVIDDIGSIKTKMTKERADLHQEIRTLLSDEQRVYFDTHYLSKKTCKHRGNCMHKGNCKHMGQGHGKK